MEQALPGALTTQNRKTSLDSSGVNAGGWRDRFLYFRGADAIKPGMTEIKRYVPLAAWIIVCLTLVCVAGRIIGLGYLPQDDALRHAAKAVSGKAWPEILVMRADFGMDPHPGWHAILGGIHRLRHCDVETLVVLPVAGLMLLFSVAGLAWLRRPEAWLGALLAAAVFCPDFILRLSYGRPYLFTIAAYMALLLVWSRVEKRSPGLWEMVATVLLIAAAAWVHGSFYQLILPAAGLFLAGRWRQAVWFGVLWAGGSVLGAEMTGHPWVFLDQCVRHLLGVFGGPTLTRQLVPELQPSNGGGLFLLALTAMLFWRARASDGKERHLLEPVFVMGVLGWILGLKVGRFWWDWGLPAFLIWLARELESQLQNLMPFDSGQRLSLTLALALAVFFGIGSDRDGRWTSNLTKQYLAQNDPALQGWLPENGGIIYSVDMTVFNDLFFKNPTAPWRYVLGFESALMLPEDLAVVRDVAWSYGDLRGYDPWLKKIRPQDRLIIPESWLPTTGLTRGGNIAELEWHRAANGWWIGRLRRP